MRRVIALILGSYTFCFATYAASPASKYSGPLSAWLADNSKYRLAVDKDCECDFVINLNKREFGEGYTPYRVSGNFDGDTIGDVAVVVVNKKHPDDFRILVFASRLANGRKPVVYTKVLDDQNLNGIGLAIKPSKGRDLLLFGTLNSEGAEVIRIPDQVP